MTRMLTTFIAIVTGFFILVGSLIIAIPLAILGAITGRRLVKAAQKAQAQSGHSQQTDNRIIDGEFEEISK